MTALIPKRGSTKSGRNIAVVYGVELRDAREEVFVMLVCDGLPMGVAFRKAGFESKAHDAPSNLFNLPRVQERANAILEARRTQGVVTLPEVTDMLKRVFAGAHAAEEFSAAHNAAFSLARLYGHVTDRATLEVIRRPSRDPDAPSEQALSSWVEALPALPGPGPGLPGEASFLRLPDAPAPPLGRHVPGPEGQSPNENKALASPEPPFHQAPTAGPEGPGPELSNNINWLGLDGKGVGGRPENGAPSRAVTVTPTERGPSGVLGPGAPGVPPEQKGAPTPDRQVPGTNTGPEGIPSFEELFG
jgi:hypothetical protein